MEKSQTESTGHYLHQDYDKVLINSVSSDDFKIQASGKK